MKTTKKLSIMKRNYLHLAILTLSFMFVFNTGNAQVWVDTTGNNILVDVGTPVTQGDDFYKVVVKNGGTLNTAAPDINVLIIEEGGTVTVSDVLDINDSICVKGTINLSSYMLDLYVTGPHYIIFDSNATINGLNSIRFRDRGHIINHKDGLYIPDLELNGKASGGGTAYIEGSKMININNLTTSNRNNMNLDLQQDLIISNQIDWGGKSNGSITLNEYDLILNAAYSNANMNNSTFDVTGGGTIVYGLTAGLKSDLPPLKIDSKFTNLEFEVNAGAALGTTFPALKLNLIPDTLLPGVSEQVTKVAQVEYNDITTPDFKIKYDFNTVTDVVGDTLNLFNANYNPDSASWVIGSALTGDTVVYSGDIKGIITARGPINESAKISVGDTLTEITLDSSFINIDLFDVTFLDATLDKANFTLVNAPSGVTTNSVIYSSESSAKLILSYDKTNFDADVDNFKIMIGASEISTATDITSDSLYIKALSNDSTLSDLTVGGTTISGFVSDSFSYDVTLVAGADSTVAAVTTDNNAVIYTIIQTDNIPGTATVKVISEDGHTATYTINFILYTDTDILNQTEAVTVYPVPAVNILKVNVGSALSQINIVNMLGVTVLSKDNVSGETVFPVSQLAGGEYLIVISNKNVTVTKKVQINK